MQSDARVFTSAANRWNKFEEFNGFAFAALNEISKRLALSETLSTDEKLEMVSTKSFYLKYPLLLSE